MAEYRHYNKGRYIDKLGNYYTRHVSAMTIEGLHSKSAIAAELGWRDSEIDRLSTELDKEKRLSEAISRDCNKCALQRNEALDRLAKCKELIKKLEEL